MKYYGHKVHINDIATKVIFYKNHGKIKINKTLKKISILFVKATCIFRVVCILSVCECKARVFQMMTIFCKEGFFS